MRAVRGGLVLLTVGCAVLSGCTPNPPTAPSPTSSTAESSTYEVDLARLGEIADDFPTDYPVTPNPLPGVRKPDAAQAGMIGDFVSYGKRLTAEPESCRALLKPVEAKAGTDRASVSSMTGVDDPFIAVTVTDPVSVPIPLPDSGCERFTFTVQGAVPDGSIEQLTAPTFDDATTYGLKVELPITNPYSTKVALVEYFYTAVLDGRTFVNVWARVPPEFKPEPVLPDLLTKAVAAIRGQ